MTARDWHLFQQFCREKQQWEEQKEWDRRDRLRAEYLVKHRQAFNQWYEKYIRGGLLHRKLSECFKEEVGDAAKEFVYSLTEDWKIEDFQEESEKSRGVFERLQK